MNAHSTYVPSSMCPVCGREFRAPGGVSNRFACSSTCQEVHRQRIGFTAHRVIKRAGLA